MNMVANNTINASALTNYSDIDLNNICWLMDSYKVGHWKQYPEGTEYVYSYFESRTGAKFPETVFFGLQYILKKYLAGVVVTREKIEDAAKLFKAHFGTDEMFNRAGWEYILDKRGGVLPLMISAVPEGTVVPVSNAMMVSVNTDKNCYWLSNAAETILTHVWSPSTVATLSRTVKKTIKKYLEETTDNLAGLPFMLHDFGFRGVSSVESAASAGAGHLVNFLGTDTLVAIPFITNYYGNGSYDNIAFSVAATEHSVMTSLGEEGEPEMIKTLLENHPTGILSVVGDSYDIYRFIDKYIGQDFKQQILERGGCFVARPDSMTPTHKTPAELMVWIFESLWKNFGGTINTKGYKVINPKIRVLWGDGLSLETIEEILIAVKNAGFSIENIATFGMGGGLLQKVNRDTQRFAFKCSAQYRDGVWYDIQKRPLDTSKTSKTGRLTLIKDKSGEYQTVPIDNKNQYNEQLLLAFMNGVIVNDQNFSDIRKRAEL